MLCNVEFLPMFPFFYITNAIARNLKQMAINMDISSLNIEKHLTILFYELV